LSALSKISDVTFLSATRDGVQEGVPMACQKLCKEIRFFPAERVGWLSDAELPILFRKWKGLRRRLNPNPVLFQWYGSAEEISFLKSLALEDFDLIWMERLFFLNLLPTSLKVRLLIDLDDLEHRKLRRELKLDKLNGSFFLNYIEFMKLRRLELTLLRRSCELVVCSETDKHILGDDPRVWVVPNGVEVPAESFEQVADKAGPVFLFVGYMAYKANIDAVQWFAHQILPLIRRVQPNATFFIVGREPASSVRELHDGRSIFVTGTVPSVEPFLRQASIVVAPLRSGGGTRIKILEAMAHRRPVVSTSVGAEGLEVESGKHLLIANTPSEFADACVRLAQAPSMRRELTESAFEFIRGKYDWSKIQSKVMRIALGHRSDLNPSQKEDLCLQA
jgi:glycosyltransferase involved in cell wall biosynthesis